MSSNELSVSDTDPCIRTFKEHMHLELEPPKLAGGVAGKRGATSPKLSPRSSPRLFRKLMVNKSIRQRRRFTVAHTCLSSVFPTAQRKDTPQNLTREPKMWYVVVMIPPK
ncbi:unnamed protein product [Arctogadus glacialis]